jgi:hypothetical protein
MGIHAPASDAGDSLARKYAGGKGGLTSSLGIHALFAEPQFMLPKVILGGMRYASGSSLQPEWSHPPARGENVKYGQQAGGTSAEKVNVSPEDSCPSKSLSVQETVHLAAGAEMNAVAPLTVEPPNGDPSVPSSTRLTRRFCGAIGELAGATVVTAHAQKKASS